jgi:hypothetical protein
VSNKWQSIETTQRYEVQVGDGWHCLDTAATEQEGRRRLHQWAATYPNSEMRLVYTTEREIVRATPEEP